MAGHIPDSVKKERAEAVRRLSVEMKRIYRESLIGSVQDVLVEKAEEQPDGSLMARGLSASYVPVRFGLPGTRKPDDVKNQLFQVKIDSIESGDDPDLLGSGIRISSE